MVWFIIILLKALFVFITTRQIRPFMMIEKKSKKLKFSKISHISYIAILHTLSLVSPTMSRYVVKLDTPVYVDTLQFCSERESGKKIFAVIFEIGIFQPVPIKFHRTASISLS